MKPPGSTNLMETEGGIGHLRLRPGENELRATQRLSVGALIVAVTPVGAACGLPLPALVGAGGDIAGSGGGRRHPNAIAPVTPLTVAIDVATVDVYVPIDIDVAIDIPVDTHVSIDADVAVNAPIEVRTSMRVSIDVRAAMNTGMTATRKAAPAPSVSRCSKYHRQESDGAQQRYGLLHVRPPGEPRSGRVSATRSQALIEALPEFARSQPAWRMSADAQRQFQRGWPGLSGSERWERLELPCQTRWRPRHRARLVMYLPR